MTRRLRVELRQLIVASVSDVRYRAVLPPRHAL